jgi:PAS domain-containing protein
VTIPSDDVAFREHVRRLSEGHPDARPHDLERRLRRLFPRVVVQARELAAEPATWYVYRDGAWRPHAGSWWTNPMVSHIVFDAEGWITDANAPARSLLGLGVGDPHHYTDLVAPGTTDDVRMMFGIVAEGHPISATVVLRPVDGEVIACEIRAQRSDRDLEVWLRLAADVDPGPRPDPVPLPELVTRPPDDAVFAAYTLRLLRGMPDPSADGLALRLHRVFPHARVMASDPQRWVAHRDGTDHGGPEAPWWHDERLPRVRFDDRGLILDADRAAVELLGEPLVGRHWQELVTPGSQDQVATVLDIIRAAGEVVSRFRLPAADGQLVEFDSHTRIDGDEFETVMRPLGRGTPDDLS